MIWTAGSITGLAGSALNLGPGSISTIAPPGDGSIADRILNGRTLNNSGIVNQKANISGSSATINNLVGATWNANATVSHGIVFNNSGHFVGTDAEVDGPFSNSGDVAVKSNIVPNPNFPWYSGLVLAGGGTASGSFNVANGAALIFGIGPNTYNFTTGATITGGGLVYCNSGINALGNTTIDPYFFDEGGPVTVAPNVTSP